MSGGCIFQQVGLVQRRSHLLESLGVNAVEINGECTGLEHCQGVRPANPSGYRAFQESAVTSPL